MRNSEGAAAGHLICGRSKTFVKVSSVRQLRLQGYARLNISNMVSNMANMTTSLSTSQPLSKVVPSEFAIICLVEHFEGKGKHFYQETSVCNDWHPLKECKKTN